MTIYLNRQQTKGVVGTAAVLGANKVLAHGKLELDGFVPTDFGLTAASEADVPLALKCWIQPEFSADVEVKPDEAVEGRYLIGCGGTNIGSAHVAGVVPHAPAVQRT